MSVYGRFVLAHQTARQNAIEAIRNAPEGLEVEIRDPKRSLDQNAALWALLGEISSQVNWHGQKLSPEDWKHIFSASLKKQRVTPGLDGGFVVLGLSTSRMTKKEFSDLLELAHAFAAQQGVRLSA